MLVRRNGPTISNPSNWISITLTPAFASWFVEQLFGSPTPVGVIIFWILIGGHSAMLFGNNTEPAKKLTRTGRSSLVQYAVYTGVVLILGGSIAVGWDKGANYLIANQMSSFQYASEGSIGG